MASAATDVLRGRRGGSYRILRRIAVGGMSEVFEAEGAFGGPRSRVVLKVMLPHLAKAKDARSAFAHEAEIGARVEDAHLVRALDDGEHDGAPFLVLERVDGATLLDVLGVSRLPLSAVLVVAADLLSALARLHAATDEAGAALGIVHRDVSPDNALVDRTGQVKLADLGIARSRLRSQRTQTGIVRGKAAYLSPEQITGSDVDARADLYSLGAVLFEAATGERHARGDTDIEILRNAENPRFVAPSTLGADPRLDTLLRRALARFPEDRCPTASAMRREVLSLLDSLGEGAELAGRRALAEAVEKAAPTQIEESAGEESASKESAGGQSPGKESVGGESTGGQSPDKESVGGELVGGESTGKEPTGGESVGGRPRSWGRWLGGVGLLAVILWLGIRTFRGEGAFVQASGSGAGLLSPGERGPVASGTESTAPRDAPALDAPSRETPSLPSTLPAPSTTSSDGAAPRSSARAPLSGSSSGDPLPPSDSPALPGALSAVPGTSGTLSSTGPLASPPPTAPLSASAASVSAEREAAQRRIQAVSAALREAKARGRDVSALEDRAAVALQAFLDGRYGDTQRELDAIAARIPR